MRKRITGAAALLAASNLLVMPLSAVAAPICWIDRIAKAEGGVDIYFMQQARLGINIPGSANEAPAGYTASGGVVRDASGHSQDHLFVREGRTFYASQLVEDSCSYEVGTTGGVGTLTIKSAMTLPGLKPMYTGQIIKTDGSVSETWLLPASN